MGTEGQNISSYNRYVEGHKNTKLIAVQGGVTVSIGDFMFLDNADNLRNNGSSTATNYAFPVCYLRSGTSIEQNKTAAKTVFLGVALDDKDGQSNGPDYLIPIASAGKFNYPLKPNKTVYAGKMFSLSGTSTNSDILNQSVALTTSVDQAVGYFAESKVHAQTADIVLRTAFSAQLIS